MAGVRRGTTKHDVALAEVHRKASREVMLARGFVIALGILASALPIYALQDVVEPLAGKDTKVDVSLVFSVTVAISVVLNGLQYVKGRSQRAALQRLRRRVRELEGGNP